MATTAPKRREVTRWEGRRRPHQGLVSHVQGFYLKCDESLRRGLGGEVTCANFCFKTILLAVVRRISWKGVRGEAGCLIRRLLKILEGACVEEGGGGSSWHYVNSARLAVATLWLANPIGLTHWARREKPMFEWELPPLPPPVTGVTRQFKNTVHICIGSFILVQRYRVNLDLRFSILKLQQEDRAT